MEKSDNIVANCFNDWRRSNIKEILLNLRRHSLLLDSHVQNLSGAARDWLIIGRGNGKG